MALTPNPPAGAASGDIPHPIEPGAPRRPADAISPATAPFGAAPEVIGTEDALPDPIPPQPAPTGWLMAGNGPWLLLGALAAMAILVVLLR